MSLHILIRKYLVPLLLLLTILNAAYPAAARPLAVETGILNVRSGPGVDRSVIAQINRGTVVTAVEENSAWLRVILPSGAAGWVSAQFTGAYLPSRYALVDVSLLNVRSGPGTNHRLITGLARNIAVPVLQEQDSWLLVILPQGGQGWLAGRHTRAVEFIGYVSVTASLLNLRSEPGTESLVMGQMPRGEILSVLARENGWLRVARLNGELGWVSEGFVSATDNPPESPQPSPASPLNGKTIVIDAGHGGSDPGAVGVTGFFEKSLNLAVALELAPMLRSAGANLILTRWSDLSLTLWNRVNMANSNSADLFVSIHGNAHLQPRISGTETYYYPWTPHSSRSRILAEHLQRQLVSALGLRDIGVKTANFYVIANTQMPSALVELGFLSNQGDEALLKQPLTHRRSAEAIFRGLENFLRGS